MVLSRRVSLSLFSFQRPRRRAGSSSSRFTFPIHFAPTGGKPNSFLISVRLQELINTILFASGSRMPYDTNSSTRACLSDTGKSTTSCGNSSLGPSDTRTIFLAAAAYTVLLSSRWVTILIAFIVLLILPSDAFESTIMVLPMNFDRDGSGKDIPAARMNAIASSLEDALNAFSLGIPSIMVRSSST